MTINFKVNGSSVSVDAPADTPLLWVIREQLKLAAMNIRPAWAKCR